MVSYLNKLKFLFILSKHIYLILDNLTLARINWSFLILKKFKSSYIVENFFHT